MIDPMTGLGLAQALAGINAAMQGQTLADEYNRRITGQYHTDNGPTIGFADYTSNTPAISGDTSGSISTGSGDTPEDAWNDYVENTPSATVSDTTGGVVSGSKVGTFVYSIMEENPGTARAEVKALAPVAVPLDAAITAMGQAVGVSIDATNLDVKTKQALVNSYVSVSGVVYDKAKGLVTAWKDELGRILFPKKVFDSVYQTVEELGIGVKGNELVPVPGFIVSCSFIFTSGVEFVQYDGLHEGRVVVDKIVRASINSRNKAIIANDSSFYLTMYRRNVPSSTQPNPQWGSIFGGGSQPYTKNGKTVHYMYGSGGGELDKEMWRALCSGTDYVTDYVSFGELAWYMVYGDYHEGGGYPEGTSESEAEKYTPSTIPVAGNLATSYDPDTGDLGTEPLVPINVPENPYDATGSTVDPTSPTDEDNPGVVNPPIPLPIPDTRPSNPAIPLVNPSVIDSTRVAELVEELATTLDPQPGQSSGIIPIPPLPGITDPDTGVRTFPSIIPESGPGFIHVYNPTPDEFVAFGSWLWVTYADATIDKILNNPFDGVIGAHELYATPNRGGRDNIRSAFLVCPTSADLVPNRYSEIDCGTVIVPEFYGNYLDYSPYSQAYIYLPFVGINEVSIDDIVGHAVNIRYRVDSYSGACIAMIFVAKDGYQNLCYQFAGSCSVEVPMAGGSQAAIKAGMMQAEAYARAAMVSAGGHLLGGIGSALMGSLGGAISSVAGIAGDYANAKAGVEAARVANKSNVQHSGQFGASHGAMGQKVPFIIIRNPIQVKVVNYNDDYGFPAHKRVIIGGCTGYLRVREVNVVSAHATDDEKAAIEALLKNGVYVS